jgi:hypothetical protein
MLPVFQSKCLRIATRAPWYISNRQIHEDFEVPFFADHIKALTESFDSKVSCCGEPLSSATRPIFTLTEGNLIHLKRSKPRAFKVAVCRGCHDRSIKETNRAHLALFLYPD